MQAATSMTLRTCQVKEADQKRPHIVWFHLYEMHRTGTFIQIDGSLVVTYDRQVCRKMGVIANGYRISFGEGEKFLILIVLMAVLFCDYTKIH